ncbi:pilus assembly PilX family protein [Kingella negevensis]|uniref:Type 4 fimbrial biogenesis protein PilX N-terminal domain-containing protein n=1 Tax=Kingella negevensis TaxID=1522312 RepID=A0A238HGT5_9NEIS|nr:PilX N-terminal domain-containing pilus assembly protein [Kingella negevensis]MDK4680739.1 PilX N-terminal domain-containing pilus assembly protein [Kingella negevensis]MDK4681538.1 PilX N-terminal domain-containing pilus assembly protein [Kingella negevensis]MDK4687810.1 PilX N-terminal domain-containing pilus assembly protein [Kingella negevensis]MDK4691925.1 PilX N-terminal domain-containing pilus assembly protein [Kingella negevensis]MDK4692922.1 PilX N-terminal domain-containing pilus 
MKNKNQGFSLFMVLILMLVIALLVMVTTQSATTEMRASTNEADRKLAVSLAEKGLRAGEENIYKLSKNSGSVTNFTVNCDGGYCLPALENVSNLNGTNQFKLVVVKTKNSAWERCAKNPEQACSLGETVLDKVCEANKKCFTAENGKVRYIIEYLGNKITDAKTGEAKDYFRITSRAQGNNKDTLVTLQSYIELYLP